MKLTKRQVEFLEGLRGYIDFILKNRDENFSFPAVLYTISHDVSGTIANDPFFLPRTSGYRKKNEK